MEIKMLKLLSGEEILGGIKSIDDKFVEIESPVVVIPSQGPDGKTSIQFAEYPMFTHKDQKFFKINKNLVVLEPYQAPENFENQWRQIYGSGIVVPGIQLARK
jgi:hypothetical protein